MKQLVSKNWDAILEMLKNDFEIKPVLFKTFIEPLKVYDEDDDKVTILLDDDVYQHYDSYIKEKFYTFIKNSIEAVTGKSYSLDFISKEELESYDTEKNENNQLIERAASANLNPNYTFDTFVVGPNNDFIAAAAKAVAKDPNTDWNPLFIYGGVGLGKTHLMHSIAHSILENQKDARVLYVTSEQFTNEVIESIKEGVLASTKLRKKYRNIDALLIDDIQFVIGKERTEEEFFHTFNDLYQAGKRIIISSDRPPKDFTNIEDRIKSRFGNGMMAEINPPDYETRMAILKKRCELEHEHLSDEILDYIATNVNSNIRELEGAYKKVTALNKLVNVNTEATLDIAKNALKDIINPNVKNVITIDSIIDVVASHYELSIDQICSANRSSNVAYPRQIAMYLCKQLTPASLKEIAAKLGKKDHSTILHGIKKIEEDLEAEKKANKNDLSNKLDVITKLISS
ncbi:chromosomal replication initiator protein DnaA [Catonella massiliensis]|jgi:chromosomal replication initiator protein dnaA|uniref:Chromosomal replication initiator protein DnaA n=1 Tax=Catonella massiliensis TaxID=2799636 RepID=A0ABS1J388_9FIRM|nr:chromosomal replication initiator protein DnaA [Catonella massiliensis]MBK5898617.1 chromosomal replication initiator protein DnaA [Catonella massiliensis]